jgi:hypothetical protein
MRRFNAYIVLMIIAFAISGFASGQNHRDTILRKRSALNYQLQSKPRLPHFPAKVHFEQFFSISQYVSYSLPQGVTAGVDMCKFVTPLFGLRAGINIGSVKFPNAASGEMYHPKVDAVLDLGAFGWGYNPSRIFTVWAIAGIDGAFTKNNPEAASYRFAYGGHVALLMNLRLSHTLYFSLESSATLFSDRFNGSVDWHIADPIAEFHAGLSYRRPLVTQKYYSRFKASKKNFISLGAGVQSLPLSTIGTKGKSSLWKSTGACMMINIGRWVSTLSGIRATFSYGVSPILWEEEAKQHGSLLGASVDYLYRLTDGENLKNTFSWFVIAGGNFVYSTISKRYEQNEAIYNFGFNSGLNVCYNVNSSLSFFLEPKATIYGSWLNSSNTGRVMLNLNTGIVVRW